MILAVIDAPCTVSLEYTFFDVILMQIAMLITFVSLNIFLLFSIAIEN